MTKGKLIFFLLLFLNVVIYPMYASEQNSELLELPTIKLNVSQSSKSISAPFDGEITLTNLTSKAYEIKSVTLHLPHGLTSIRKNFNATIYSEKHEILGNDQRIYSFSISRVSMPYWESIFNTDTLLFVPGEYGLRAEIKLEGSGGKEKGIRSLYSSIQVELEPPLSAALRGGIVGALLLAIFVPAFRILRSTVKKVELPSYSLKSLVGQFFIYAIAGSVVAITTILFIHRMESANLPISISVNDYLGGVIIGLLSYVFGDVLFKKFFGEA